MCLVFLAKQVFADYPLVVLFNRDEHLVNPTKQAELWKENSAVLAGRDLQKGGTWGGVNRRGYLALLTFFREPWREGFIPKRARGELVRDFLLHPTSPDDYLEEIRERCGEYLGFNLIVGTPERLLYFSNIEERTQPISEGVHGLSNAFLNTSWPKVDRGKEQLRTFTAQQSISTESCFALMSDETRAPDRALPKTGVSLERERELSSIFVRSPGYQTRSTTLIFFGRGGDIRFIERAHDLPSESEAEREFHFSARQN